MEYCKAMKKGLEGHDMLSLKKKIPVSDCFWKKKVQFQTETERCTSLFFKKLHTHRERSASTYI